jgi:DNA replication and repair protein RecF
LLLKTLSLEHYRNIGQLRLEASPEVNILIGENAQGKTNILESLFVLALLRSHRTHKDRELIGWDSEHAVIAADITRKLGDVRLHLVISGQGKKARINGLEQQKLSQFIGTLNVVMFAPEDLEIVKGSPGIRRRFMDMEIGQVHPSYLYHLQQYQRIVVQKNQYFKKTGPGGTNDMMLDVWNEQLARAGVKIIRMRQHFITKLQAWAEQIHRGITGGREQLVVTYKPSVDFGEEEDETVLVNQFMIKLSQAKEQETRRGMCLIGPHRDDLSFAVNGKDVHAFGSQGQQRTVSLSLKLAELELIRSEVGEYPILLLDDVLSELDRNRQSQLIETFRGKVQTFITTTSIDSIEAASLKDARLFRVQAGRVIE